jgi:hypothetical protein
VTAALIKCMEVLYIQNMKVLSYNQVYNTKIFIFPAGGEWSSVLTGYTVCTLGFVCSLGVTHTLQTNTHSCGHDNETDGIF